MLDKKIEERILTSTSSSLILSKELIQSLWSGYGSIYRIHTNGEIRHVVAKHVYFPNQIKHPRGWSSDLSHKRKVKSYQVEMNWYRNFANECGEKCRIPQSYLLESYPNEELMVMEDLDAVGYPVRKNAVNWNEMLACLKWLANFHATFLNKQPNGLWEIGTYWHLETRPDELDVLDDKALKEKAMVIDEKLNTAKFKTFVHGDAKLANFCFSKDGESVAAVDFQYVGGGCGMKDVAYFVGSCFYEEDCEKYEKQILDEYFTELKASITSKSIDVDIDELEKEWRELYPVAWTDFHRFIKGWSPGHWKINSYSERIVRKVIQEIS